MDIQHFSHEGKLSFHEETEDANCDGCVLDISGAPAYVCEDCGFCLHKLCAEFPREMSHPLHLQHPLTLLTEPPNDALLSICDGCRDISTAFIFHCKVCQFNLDVKCASLTEDQCQRLKVKEMKTKVNHFSHKHTLSVANYNWEFEAYCNGCQMPIFGQVYCCIDCQFFLHESCLEIPQELEQPFHPQHPLLARDTGLYNTVKCKVCKLRIYGISFSCDECNFDLHVSCATCLTPTLKHKCHEHMLLYFVVNFDKSFPCKACGKNCRGSLYRCVECDLNFHLKCVPIPHIVKHKRHIHPLKLMDSVVEDDSGEYYCDACEAERNEKHHVYSCKECPYVAHIQCVVSEDESSIEILSYLGVPSAMEEIEQEEEESDETESQSCSPVTEEVSDPEEEGYAEEDSGSKKESYAEEERVSEEESYTEEENDVEEESDGEEENDEEEENDKEEASSASDAALSEQEEEITDLVEKMEALKHN